MTTISSFRASRAIGAMFFSLLGGVWLGLWAVRSFGTQMPTLTMIVIATIGIFAFAFYQFQKNKNALIREANSPEKQNANRIFNFVNAGQWVLILIVGNVLVNLGYSQWVLASAIFVIGVHFLPLAKVFNYWPHYVTAAMLICWAITYPFLTQAGAANPIGCLGTGILLWGSALYGLLLKPKQSNAEN